MGQTKKIRPVTAAELEALCKALADTSEGLTGSEIGYALSQCRIQDPEPTNTKRRRLFNALVGEQNREQSAKPVLNFIYHALAPARYSGELHKFEQRRASVNVPLAFLGLQFQADGKFAKVAAATTLEEAEQRANRLRATLQARSIHADVLTFCKKELLADNYFHAVQEASKSVAEKIRTRALLTSDGGELVDEAFGGPDPFLRINAFISKSERSEQSGFLNLLKGLFGAFRNPTAHAPRIAWPMPEEDARYLNTSESAVEKWETAAKRPSGTALKLLTIVKKRGLQVLT